ncbi:MULTISPECIES: ABC transporter substrate-binding protein [Phaeobacter]|uniref:ABC transporter substrate-binding protein n=1 Tax=Phaeobacter TaxID=302485 RepID=UPI0003FA3985|nr:MULTISPECIES: ABC transporter substrate-binding protein [Phaeobacter]AUQ55641.1 putative amino acid transporter, extracellular ligand-binding receptor [Phaeobacter inhibens]AUQ79657.1 putative amino acid transporter, extracellular ligand-binding receptor [Phaeobacter inhibens]AUR05050.1 putative amino acid transporter, extracellular ligand-binding receptor [Phaeobacter inhibens]AUR16816.1 putative amino acid transporter, extracellular ligand-binding receptor [Phaeobacter inhibens]
MKKILLASTMAVATLAAPVSAEVLKIGLATAQTGGLAGYDGPVIEGLHIAVDEINAAGGINGNIKIELIEKDVRSDAAQTAIAVQELADEGVSVLVLPCDADPSLAAIGTVTSAQIPAISTCASSPTLPMIGGDFMFANFPGDNVQATVSAEWAHQQGHKSAYIIYSPDSQYTTMPLYFADVFKALGGEMLGEDTHSIGQQDFSAIATRIAALNPQPDVIMTSSYEPDFPSMLKALRAAGVTAQMIGSDGIDSPTTFSLGDTGEGVVFTTAGHATEGSPLADFNAKYEAATGSASETVFNAVGYDLIIVVAEAVKAAGGSTDPVAIRTAMAELENVRGATSLITYKGTNGMPVREVTLIRVKDGERELIGQPSPTADLIPAPRMQ